MAKAGVTYETVSPVTHVGYGGPNGPIDVWADKPYTTNDPAEQAALDAHPDLQRAKKGASK